MRILYILLFVAFVSCKQTSKKEEKVLDAEKNAIIESATKAIESATKTPKPTKEDIEIFQKIESGLTFKKFPILETTNFDNFKEQKFLTKREAEVLKLDQIYADFNTSPNLYKVVAFYKIDFSKDFYSIVFVVFQGDTQMNSILVNYNKNLEIIDYTVVAYDEIAEGWSKTTSRISKNIITTFEVLHTDEVQVIQKEYLVNFNGKLGEIDRKKLHETINNFPFIFKALNTYNVNITNIKTDFLISKALPNNEEEIIIVIPEVNTESADEFTLDGHILIANNLTGKISQAFFESYRNNEWVSDAIRLDNITIDTAPYRLTDDVRAFGIRTSYIGSSRVNPYYNETLSLFIKYDSTFKKVLNNFSVKDYGGEQDDSCSVEIIEHKKTLIMSEEKTNGYYDIIVKNKITTSTSTEDENGNCDTRKRSITKTSVLKFDGVSYKISN